MVEENNKEKTEEETAEEEINICSNCKQKLKTLPGGACIYCGFIQGL